jgi:capsular polysaccharide biosynthesis protein
MDEVNKNIESKNPIIKDDEIDLIEVAKTIWAGRKLILKVTAVFFVIGLVIAFGSKVEYEASCRLMPESQEGVKSNLGGLGSLAGLAGINLDMMSDSYALTPELYPEIAQSTPFLLSMLNTPIQFEKYDTTTTAYTYFRLEKKNFISVIFKYTLGLPFVFKKWLTKSIKISAIEKKDDRLIRLNKEDSKILENFKERIHVTVDPQTGILTFTTEMPDALAASVLTQLGIDFLTHYIIEYKVGKAKENLDFIQNRFDEAKIIFQNTQERLAIFNDRNRNVVTSQGQTEQMRLQNEYNLAFEVFKGLSSQLEQAKIKVKEQTPVFTVLEPVRIPIDKSKPQIVLILIVTTLFGIFFSVIYILIKYMFRLALPTKVHKLQS